MSRDITTICPHCGAEHTRTTALVERGHPGPEPRMGPGDYTLCFSCGEFATMGATGMLRRPTHSEMRAINRDKRAVAAREGWQQLHATRQ